MNLSLLKMQNSSTKNIKMFALPAIILLLSSLYLIFAWFRYVDIAADEALKLVQSLESIFHPEHIAELTGSAEDIEKPEYILTKNSLVKLVENTPSIHNAYFLVERNGRLIFLLDTEPYDSPYFVSPGQIFEEADSMYLKPFKTGETVLTEPMSDRWGRWISALVPVRDPSDQNIISVLGIDFSASEWYADIRRHMIPDIIIVMSIISICVVYIKTKSTSLALWESERSKSVLLSHLPGLAYRCNYDKDWTMQFVSQGCKDLTGYPAESLLYNKLISYNNIIVPEYREILYNEWKRVLANRLPFKYEYEIITAENERKWVLEMGQGIFDDKGRVEALEGIVLDISDQKKLESYLKYIIEHDSLTGLYNGRFLEETLNTGMQKRNVQQEVL